MINQLPSAIESILYCTLNIQLTQTGKKTVTKLITSTGVFILIILYCQCPLIAQGAGNALSFDGNDDYVDLTVGDYLTNSEGTFEAWIKPVCAGEEGRIITITDKSEGSDYNYSESGCKVVIRIREAGSDFVYATTVNQVLSAGSWSHIVYQQNGSGIQLFVDGIQITNFTVSGGSLTTTAWNDDVLGADGATIGVWEKDAGKINYFEGTIDEVRIWSVARTEVQIRDNMCKKLTGSETGLVGYWRIDDGNGQTVDDLTNNENDGTLGSSSGTDDADPSWVTSGAAIGDASTSDYSSPSSVNLTHSDGDDITVSSISGSPDGVQIYRVDSAPNVTTVPSSSGWDKLDPERYWGIFVVGGSSPTYTITYNYNGHPGITGENDLVLAYRADNSTTSWTDLGATRDTDANTLTKTGQSGTEYILGSTTSDNSLPVTLTSFTARQDGGAVVLEWVTESEIENLGFIIEKRIDDQNGWDEIASYKTHAELRGQGSTTSRTEYQFTDATVQPGWTYEYRLTDVDYSGNTKYHYTRSVTIKSANQLLIPETFSLKPAYPNPFNPYTVIPFTLPEAAAVSMRVIDVTGKTVSLLVNNRGYPAGEFSILWNGRSNAGIPVASGVYFLQLITGDNIRSQKIVLLR